MRGVYSDAIFSDSEAISALLVIIATVSVFLLIAAHTLIESGLIRFKNSHFHMMKNLIIACIAILMWWMVGYGLAFANIHRFIGNDGWYFASGGFEKLQRDNYIRFIYELAFCVLTCILFTGALAERTRMIAYCGYAFLLSGYIYPVIVAWVWGSGWLA
jgi:Amt family ammonium transporter